MPEKNDHKEALVIGIGNEYRSDDGAGILVARTIQHKQIPFMTIKEETGEGMSLIDSWQGFNNVILVDAVSSGAEAGTVYRININKESLPAGFFHYSSHAFSVAEAVELARVMGLLPRNLFIYGIEGKNYDAGTSVSLEVNQAAEKVIAQIESDAGKIFKDAGFVN